MKRYGFITKDGYLRALYDNELGDRLAEFIAAGWKPVDDIDQSKVDCGDGYTVRILARDAGDHIALTYEKVVDVQAIRAEIDSLKKELSDSDYKVIKNYESVMAGEEPPYDMTALHRERQAIRDRINQLEEKTI